MQECTDAVSATNKQKAHQINVERVAQGKSPIDYALVDVTIVDQTPTQLVFTTRGEDNQKHSYRIPKNLLWLECPTTALSPGDHGTLTISMQGLGFVSEDAPQTRIYGSTPAADGSTLLLLKWPDTGPIEPPPATTINIWPTSIVVSGYAVNDPEFHSGSVNLLDATLSASRQTISFDRGAEIALNLTEIGRGLFQMSGLAEQWLLNALKLVASKYNRDDQQRADAWSLIARWRRYLQSTEAHQDKDDARQKELQERITSTLDSLI